MSVNYKYISGYVSISWTKRYVKHRPCSIRLVLKRLRRDNRVHRRNPLWMVRELNKPMYKCMSPFKSERQNFNKVYCPIKLRTTRKLK